MVAKKTLLLASVIAATLTSPVVRANYAGKAEVVSATDINWGYLNPLRGDKSPGAADLWGDRTKNTATGMLVRFNKGFSSPPHIHNISYRGIVINGEMHNDNPTAEAMWMPAGSFWTQPAGANHITGANGESNMIYLEIDSGPYLVQPSTKHFDNGEQPINQHSTNMVWLNQKDAKAVDNTTAQITQLWGSTKVGELGGALVKLPANFSGTIVSNAKEFRAVVIGGNVEYLASSTNNKSKALIAGSYFSATDKFSHQLSTRKATTIYIRTNGVYQVIAN